jgi:hypothetical protein
MAFSADGELFYYLALDTNGQSTFSRISMATGETKVIASQLDGSAHGGQIALSPDGKVPIWLSHRTKRQTTPCATGRTPIVGSKSMRWISLLAHFNP